MNHTLPTLALRKTKELFFLNVTYYSSTFSASATQYQVKKVNGSDVTYKLLKLQCTARAEDVPYAVIADYKILAADNFAFVKIFRSNIFTEHIPLIAIADETDDVDNQILKLGIDDCYVLPVNFQDICERIEFVHQRREEFSELEEDNIEEKPRLTR